jgi:MoaA/NifB/PqqE/SkfB family radical SAM enzyme
MPFDRLIKIEPTDKMFVISWDITDHCNYDCMYCPSWFHNPIGKHLTLDELKQAWQSIYERTSHLGLKYKLGISGGEPTSSKNLLPFLKWLYQTYPGEIKQSLLNSNGSSTLKYYKTLLEYIDNLILTVHGEHINEIEFFNKIKELKSHINETHRVLHVDIMKESWNEHRIPYYTKLLTDLDVPYSVNVIRPGYGTRTYPIFKGKLNFDIPNA